MVGIERIELLGTVFGSALVLIHPESSLFGRSLRECEFRSKHGLQVTGLRRAGEVVQDFEDEKLNAGDTLLVGVPLVLLAWLTTMLVVPVFYPFIGS